LLSYKANSVEKPLFGAFLYLLFAGFAPTIQACVVNAVIVRMGLVPIFVFWALAFAGLVFIRTKHGFQARIVRANGLPRRHRLGL
jgi:hypothetical protein